MPQPPPPLRRPEDLHPGIKEPFDIHGDPETAYALWEPPAAHPRSFPDPYGTLYRLDILNVRMEVDERIHIIKILSNVYRMFRDDFQRTAGDSAVEK